jgi:alpha-ribazole phosphatase
MGRFYLIRHGETLWNTEARYQGHTDTSLNEKGLYQAKKLQDRFIKEPFHEIFSSDLSRAADTARIIAEPKNIPVHLTASLRELCFGQWEGFTYNEVILKYGESINKWYNNPDRIMVPGGEPLLSMIKRIEDFIYSLATAQPDNCFVIVTHGGPIRGIIAKINNIPLNEIWKIKIENGSITTLETNNNAIRVIAINETSHLY